MKKLDFSAIKKALHWWWKDRVDVAMAVVCIALGYYDLFIEPLPGAAAFIAFYAIFAAYRVGYMKAMIDEFVTEPFFRTYLGLKEKKK